MSQEHRAHAPLSTAAAKTDRYTEIDNIRLDLLKAI